MPETRSGVIGGVDTHSRTHHAVALDDRGERLGDAEFPATARGYRELHQWLEAFGTIAAIAVEGASSYGAGLTRWLLAQGLDVREVNQPHRHTRRRQGKSDPIDAEAAARQVLAGTAQVLPKATNGVVESIRTLANARSAAVKARSAALLQLRDLIATAPAELREALPQQTLPAKARQCARFRPDRARLDQPLQAAKLALRSVAHHVAELDRAVADLDQALRSLVERVAPGSLALPGVGIVNAAQLLLTAGENIGRLSSEAAFARLCGAAPLEASSGRTQRHRLNPGGDRQANSALYRIVLVRLRYCARTRAYPESTDRSLRGRAAGLAESSGGVAAFAGRRRGRTGARSRRSARLGGAEGAGARVREACAGMLARGLEPGSHCERASGGER